MTEIQSGVHESGATPYLTGSSWSESGHGLDDI